MLITVVVAIELYSTLKTSHPAFLQVLDDKLTVSSFGLFGSKMSQFDYSAKEGTFGKENMVVNSDKMVWPNVIKPTNTPSKGALIGDGFLVPGKAQGAIWHLVDGQATMITKKLSGWYYHRALEMDVNLDGKMDIVSCRAKAGFGKPQSKLVWFDGANNFVEHEVLDGCDVNFIITDLDKNGKKEIVYTGFWSQQLAIVTSSTGRFDTAADLKTTIISKQLGKTFDLELVDLNNDGELELLVTNHQGKKDTPTGSIYAFTPVKSGPIESWTWTMRVLLSKIPVRNSGQNEASPGSAFALPLYNTKGYPYLVAGGDGSQEAYLLTPSDIAYEYTSSVITNCEGTVGELHFDRLDGQDLLMVPCYDANEIRFFKIK